MDNVHNPNPTTISSESGFTLLEGMIAGALLGIGIMGMGAVQGFALMKTADANELSAATTLASDMLERIQFNERNVATYNGIDTKSSTNCNSINTTTQWQAKGDCLLWDGLVRNSRLNNVQGTVTASILAIPPTILNQRTVAVTLTWTDSRTQRTRSVIINRVVTPD